MSITPFHFACHIEERLRAQCEILDAPLGEFIEIHRRFSLIENRAALQFGAKPTSGEDFTTHATLSVQIVPQKDEKSAFNCVFDCPSTKFTKNFRLLLKTPEESEPQILKALSFLQKSFLPLGYTSAQPAPIPAEAVEDASAIAAMQTAQALMQASEAGKQKAPTHEPFSEEAKAATGGKKYIYEKSPSAGQAVRMRTHDGQYVPDGQLPAELRILEGLRSERLAAEATAQVAAASQETTPVAAEVTSSAEAAPLAPATNETTEAAPAVQPTEAVSAEATPVENNTSEPPAQNTASA